MKLGITYLIFLVIIGILSIVVIVSSVILIHYLIKKRNIFPYANMSPLWIITLLICKK